MNHYFTHGEQLILGLTPDRADPDHMEFFQFNGWEEANDVFPQGRANFTPLGSNPGPLWLSITSEEGKAQIVRAALQTFSEEEIPDEFIQVIQAALQDIT